MFTGWVAYGEEEIANSARAAAYADNGIIAEGVNVADCSACDSLHEILGDDAYTSPLLDHPPWYDQQVPDSADFAGVILNDITGMTGSTIQAEVVERLGDGGIVGAARARSRVLGVSALMLARTQAGLDAGLAWLTAALHPPCAGSPCRGDTLHMFSACPDVCEGMTDQDAWPVPITYSESPSFSGTRIVDLPTPLTNLLTNPSFEQGTATTVTNWQTGNIFGLATPAQAIGVVDASTVPALGGARDRTRVARVTWPNTNANQNSPFFQSLPGGTAVSGRAYRMSGWVYVPTGAPDVQITNFSGEQGDFVTVKDQWVYLSHTFVAGTGQTQVGIQCRTGNWAGTFCYADAFMLVEGGGVRGTGFSGTSIEQWNDQDSVDHTFTGPASRTVVSGYLELKWKPALDAGTNRHASYGLVNNVNPGEMYTITFDVFVPSGSPDVQPHVLFHNQGTGPIIRDKDAWVPVTMTVRAASQGFIRFGVQTPPGVPVDTSSGTAQARIDNTRAVRASYMPLLGYFDGATPDRSSANLATGITAIPLGSAILTTGVPYLNQTWTRVQALASGDGARVSIPDTALVDHAAYTAAWEVANTGSEPVDVTLAWATDLTWTSIASNFDFLTDPFAAAGAGGWSNAPFTPMPTWDSPTNTVNRVGMTEGNAFGFMRHTSAAITLPVNVGRFRVRAKVTTSVARLVEISVWQGRTAASVQGPYWQPNDTKVAFREYIETEPGVPLVVDVEFPLDPTLDWTIWRYLNPYIAVVDGPGMAGDLTLDYLDLMHRPEQSTQVFTVEPLAVQVIAVTGARADYTPALRSADLIPEAGGSILFRDVRVSATDPVTYNWTGAVDLSTSTADVYPNRFLFAVTEGANGILNGPVLDPICDEVRMDWILSDPTGGTVDVRPGVAAGGIIQEAGEVQTITGSPTFVTFTTTQSPQFPQPWVPVIQTLTGDLDKEGESVWVHGLTVSHRPILTLEQCVSPYRRTLRNVVTVDGPTVVESLAPGEETTIQRVEWTWVAAEPFVWGDPTPLLVDVPGTTSGAPAYDAPGVQLSAAASIPYGVTGPPATGTVCPMPAPSYLSCADNTCCPTLILPPQAPLISDPCVMMFEGSTITRRSFSLPPDVSPAGLGALTWTFENDANPKLGVRVRIWEDPDPDFGNVQECSFITEFTITWLAPNQTLVLNGPGQSVQAYCGLDAFLQPIWVDSLRNVRGGYGGPFRNPPVGCGRRYHMAVDVPQTYTTTCAGMYTAGQSQGSLLWSVDLTRRGG